MKLDTASSRVAYILDNLPAAHDNDLALILAYWQLFDEVTIPVEVVQKLIASGTTPETITRAKRFVLQSYRNTEEARREND